MIRITKKIYFIKSKTLIAIVSACIILVASCNRNDLNPAGVDLINDDTIQGAERFTLLGYDSCTVLTVSNPWQGAERVEHKFYLVKRGTKISASIDTSLVIYVPVKRIICTSTTHLAMISALGGEETIVGVSGTHYIYNEELYEKAKQGKIKDIGYEGGLNNELIVKLEPDLVMMYGIGSESQGFVSKIKEMGVKVMFNADYLENDPLGKAEWIKVFGALYCKEKLADSLFASISASYNSDKEYISENIESRPNVLLGLPFRDTWYISPGNSYINRLIEDAGGKYLWSETRSGISMPYGMENVYKKSMEAEYWLNTGGASSKNDILALDRRLGELPCFQNGALYNNNKRLSVAGGNDYWENGIMNPHLLLKDIASILHPDLFIDYEPFYYRKIE
jgi:iron complex transport system substrate-binding protein